MTKQEIFEQKGAEVSRMVSAYRDNIRLLTAIKDAFQPLDGEAVTKRLFNKAEKSFNVEGCRLVWSESFDSRREVNVYKGSDYIRGFVLGKSGSVFSFSEMWVDLNRGIAYSEDAIEDISRAWAKHADEYSEIMADLLHHASRYEELIEKAEGLWRINPAKVEVKI